MKIRQGFISNSSSSSFLIAGYDIALEDVKEPSDCYFVGKDLGDGADIFLLTTEIQEALEIIPELEESWYLFEAVRSGEYELCIPPNLIKSKPGNYHLKPIFYLAIVIVVLLKI